MQALALLDTAAASGERIVAPSLLPIEVTNAIRRKMLREGLNLSDARKLLSRFFVMAPAVTSSEGLSEQSLVIADAHRLPAVYDAHYVALSLLLGCDLWTDDQRLLRTLAGSLKFVRWIGDYPAGRA